MIGSYNCAREGSGQPEKCAKSQIHFPYCEVGSHTVRLRQIFPSRTPVRSSLCDMLHVPLIERLLRPLATSPDPSGQVGAIFLAMRDAWGDLQTALDTLSAAASGEDRALGYALRSRAVGDMIVSLQAASYALQRQAHESMHAYAAAVPPDEMLKGIALNELNLNRSHHA